MRPSATRSVRILFSRVIIPSACAEVKPKLEPAIVCAAVVATAACAAPDGWAIAAVTVKNAAVLETLAAASRQNRNAADPHQAALYIVYALAKAGFRIIPKGR